VVVVAGTVAGLLVASSRPGLEQPAGLRAVREMPFAIALGWQPNARGVRPAKYEIVRDGRPAVSVPASATSYEVTGLQAKTAYRFSIIAVSGTRSSAPSATILARTTTVPPVSAAVFSWTGYVAERETFSSDQNFKPVGTSWQENWSVSSDCGWQACGKATLTGSIDGGSFTAHLTGSGPTYQGSVLLDLLSSGCQADWTGNGTMSFDLTVSRAGLPDQRHWTATAFSGTVTWDAPALPAGCPAARYKMKVNSLQPAAGATSP
jgi:hypothetical protein